MRDRRGLEVGALDDAQVRLEREQPLEVGRRAVQVRLQDDADVLVPARSSGARRSRVWHRRSSTAPCRCARTGRDGPRGLTIRSRLSIRRLLVERQSEVCELERDVRAQSLSGASRSRIASYAATVAAAPAASGIASPSSVVFAWSPASFSRRRTRNALVQRLARRRSGLLRAASRNGRRLSAGRGCRPRAGWPLARSLRR